MYALDREGNRTDCAEVLKDFKAWLMKQVPLKSLSIGSAAIYTLKNWDRLTVFVDNPKVPLDNNRTERGIRGPVIGRKNHWGSKSQRGTEVASIAYSLLETAKLNGIAPDKYIVDAVLAHRNGDILLPIKTA